SGQKRAQVDDRVALDVLHVPQGADRFRRHGMPRNIGPVDPGQVECAAPREIGVDVEGGHTTSDYVWRPPSGSDAGSTGLARALVQAVDLLVERLAPAVGHRRFVGKTRVELYEERALVGQHRGQAALEVVEIAHGVRLAVAGTLGHLDEVDGESARNLLGTGGVIDAVLEEAMSEIA